MDNTERKDDDTDDDTSNTESHKNELMSPATQLRLRREANLKRNRARLASLGLLNSAAKHDVHDGSNQRISKKSSKKNQMKRSLKSEVEEEGGSNRRSVGMRMFQRSKRREMISKFQSLEDLSILWPHRLKQIRMIGKLLESCVKGCHRNDRSLLKNVDGVSVSIPSSVPVCRPMLVTGPSGTGKTGVVKDVVNWIKSKYTSSVGVAYVDASVAVSSAGDVYGNILYQLHESFNCSNENIDRNDNEIENLRSDPESSRVWQNSINSCTIFARKLSLLLQNCKCAILILDHAELFTSFGRSSLRILTQLMILPSDMNLRLNVIAISSKPFVGKSHISSSQDIDGVLEELVVPTRINFNAYETDRISIFRDILMVLRIKKSIMRTKKVNLEDQFSDRVYAAMIECILRSLLSSIREIPEIIRLSKLLWPKYIEPLTSISLKVVTDLPTITQLDILARPYVEMLIKQCMLDSSVVLSSKTTQAKMSYNDIPQATKFLMLAAFLCQHNAEQYDSNLYTNQIIGRKRRKAKSGEESIERGNVDQNANIIKIVKPFDQERMFSVFVSIYGQYGEGNSVMNSGSFTFYRSLMDLQRLGILINTSNESKTRFKCTLSEVTAERIAFDINFPLSRYLR